MEHGNTNLIATLATGLGLAFVLGLIASRFRLPLILGYLAAGLLLGPFTPGFVADKDLAHQMSEIGVSLLMFGVGLHFSIKDLLAVRKIAVPGALGRIVLGTLLGVGLAKMFGWTWGAGVVFGLALSVASTVVLLRALAERDEVDSVNGRIAIGWLIVEDVVMVLALVALPALSGAMGGKPADEGGSLAMTLGVTLVKVSVFVAGMLVIGKKAIPRLLGRVARTGSRELFTVGVLAIALGIAFGASALFDVSPALGAFFAGVVISESDLSYQASADARPIQDTFTILFFVSVGMMLDPTVLVTHFQQIVAALGVVLVGKSLISLAIILFYRLPVSSALMISASLAQIGEFSFILGEMGVSLGLLPREAHSIILAVAILSIALNPLVFRTVGPMTKLINGRRGLLRLLEVRRDETAQSIGIRSRDLANHVVLVGYGRVGRTISHALSHYNIPILVIDEDREVVDQLRKDAYLTVYGDATRPEILEHAHLDDARILVIATPPNSEAREIVKLARKLNPNLAICVRTHDVEDAHAFIELGVERMVLSELELALEMSHFILETYDKTPEAIDDTLGPLRSQGPDALAH